VPGLVTGQRQEPAAGPQKKKGEKKGGGPKKGGGGRGRGPWSSPSSTRSRLHTSRGGRGKRKKKKRGGKRSFRPVVLRGRGEGKKGGGKREKVTKKGKKGKKKKGEREGPLVGPPCTFPMRPLSGRGG